MAVAIAIPLAVIADTTLEFKKENKEPVIYEAPVPEPEIVQIELEVDWTTERIKREVDTVADTYGVSKYVMHTVVNCESRYNQYALGDGGMSRGLVQIHKGYHPHVTDDLGYDPEFSLNFLANKLANGQGHLWTCYRMYF